MNCPIAGLCSLCEFYNKFCNGVRSEFLCSVCTEFWNSIWRSKFDPLVLMWNVYSVLNCSVYPVLNRGVHPVLNRGVYPLLSRGVYPLLNRGVYPFPNCGVYPVLNRGVYPALNRGVYPVLNRSFYSVLNYNFYLFLKLFWNFYGILQSNFRPCFVETKSLISFLYQAIATAYDRAKFTLKFPFLL